MLTSQKSMHKFSHNEQKARRFKIKLALLDSLVYSDGLFLIPKPDCSNIFFLKTE